MDIFLHSEFIADNPNDLIPEDMDLDPAKLNPLEQLGLYLIGEISRGKLSELWDRSFVDGGKVVSVVAKAIEPFVPERLKG